MGWVFLLAGAGVAGVAGFPSLFNFRARHFGEWPWQPALSILDGELGFRWMFSWALVAVLGAGAAWLALRMARVGRRGRFPRSAVLVFTGALVTGLIADILFILSILFRGTPLGN